MRTIIEDIDAYIDGNPRLAKRLAVFLFDPGFHLVLRIRLAAWCHKTKVLRIISKLLWYSNTVLCGCYVSPKAHIGRAPRFPHPVGIVIGSNSSIGNNVTMYQNVTLGRRNAQDDNYPSIGDGVTLYAGAVIIGNITIAENCMIGANTLVAQSLEAGSMAFAPQATVRPARL